MAQRFDASKLELNGDAVPVAENVNALNGAGGQWGHFSASQNGVLAYIPGDAASGMQLTWFDRKGNKLGTIGAPGRLESPSLSPDESRVTFARVDASGRPDVWVWDLAHGLESRLTSTGGQLPVWSHDGAYIFYSGVRDGVRKIFRKRANGTGGEELVDSAVGDTMDASRDGRYLFSAAVGKMWVLPLSGDRKPFPYMPSESTETRPRLSPDGRWLAYTSNETGRPEIYVVTFPQPGGKWPISAGGGSDPLWSQDGRELYYYSGGSIMAVDIKPGAQFQYGVPKPLFAARMAAINFDFAVTRDGRFLLPVQLDQGIAVSMSVVWNWTEMLPKK